MQYFASAEQGLVVLILRALHSQVLLRRVGTQGTLLWGSYYCDCFSLEAELALAMGQKYL
jgi:hypothetical protein